MRSGEAAEPVLLWRKPGWAASAGLACSPASSVVIFRVSACFSKTTGHSAVECVPPRSSQSPNPRPSRTLLHSTDCLPGTLREWPGTERCTPFRAARTRWFFDRYFSRSTHSVRNRPPPQAVTAASRSMQSVSKRPPYRSSLLSAVSSSCLCQRQLRAGSSVYPLVLRPAIAWHATSVGVVDWSTRRLRQRGPFCLPTSTGGLRHHPAPRPYATLVSPASTLR